MCPRDVVDSVGELILRSVAFGVFIGPALTLVMASQTSLQVKQRIWRLVLPTYVVKNEVVSSDQVANLAFFIGEALFLGFCVPLLIPLVCVSIAATSVAFNVMISYCGLEVVNSRYVCRLDSTLLTAASMGYAFVVWFFFSCDLQGSWLVMFGAPICAAGETTATHA